ncbi:hypothetical protein A35E_00331 [secondary endosymbiont of Heteropsylla cubana]|uniref:Uncharacterized protein n=1 Tax=secondary endosymbiont of Heteropsylla cubana TaxID=134287 RepID=J3TYX4_9ENTR|nr:hypothetical protein A35E_00331 [secondary endosymbiont of Heteropsylla cubana]
MTILSANSTIKKKKIYIFHLSTKVEVLLYTEAIIGRASSRWIVKGKKRGSSSGGAIITYRAGIVHTEEQFFSIMAALSISNTIAVPPESDKADSKDFARH